MFEVGRLCRKIAGRDANNLCVVVQKLDNDYVLIDGNVRRRKCNVKHLVAEKKKLEIKEGATTQQVLETFKKAKLDVVKKTVFRGPAAESKKAKSVPAKKPAKN